ncbi:MAG: DUF3368 domain-containing protein [Phycisphaerales bacterium]|nr:DUF3368 domain-containing protein [Phycisphaerales bacterium]
MPCLEKLFVNVLLTPSVVAEFAAFGYASIATQLLASPCFEVRSPADPHLVHKLCERLHAGEAEALALAVEVRPDAVLIDERAGRAVAKELGLAPLGVLGLLVQAKHRGLIGDVKPLIAKLKTELSFRISSSVLDRVLTLAGEVA